MRKILGAMIFILPLAGIVRGASITVTQPDGGSVAMGSPVQIAWTVEGVSANVKILLRRPGGALVGTIAPNLPANSSPYVWTVGSPAVAGETYKLHVRAIDGTAEGASAAFTVMQYQEIPGEHDFSPTLKLEAPAGGESWRLGAEHEIKWTAHFLGGQVMLQLYHASGAPAGLIADDQPPSGSLLWKAGKISSGYAAEGQYKVRVVSKNDDHVHDISNQPFALTSSLADVVGPAHALLLKTVSLPGIYLNFPSDLCSPAYAHSQFPYSVYQAAMAAFNSAACNAAGANTTAIAGIHWVTMSDPRFKVGAVYRSRIHFDLGPYAGQGDNLASATLKMKRIHAIDQDANCSASCSCSEVVAVLRGVMTSFAIPGSIGQNFPLPLGQAEFTLNVTEIVKQWLDGTLANHGLLLMTNELPCSDCDRLCISCYETSLVLKME